MTNTCLRNRPAKLVGESTNREVVVLNWPDQSAERDLIDAAWPDGGNEQTLRVHVSRLRRRLLATGLTITSIRGFGYVMRDGS